MEEVYISNNPDLGGNDLSTQTKQTEISTKLEEIKVLLTLPQDLSATAKPTFAGAILTGLTSSRIVFTDANKSLVSEAADVTAAELEELSDGSETTLHSHATDVAAHTVASHSDTTGTGAELEELTDGSETALHSHVAGASVPVLVAYTNLDSESNALAPSSGGNFHAYKAVVAGWVSFYNDGLGASQTMSIYVGATDDPVGAGIKVSSTESDGSGRTGTVSALVAKDEYFECHQDAGGGGVILFKGFDTLGNPIDQD